MMKILLVQSYLGPSEPRVYPLGLAILKNALHGHEVTVFDTNTAGNPNLELSRLIQRTTPDVIGFSLRNIDSTNKRQVVFYYQFFKEAVAAVPRECPARLVAGGSGFSMFAAQVMADEPRLDFGVCLEGERTLPVLLGRLDRPETVPGVYYRRQSDVRFTGPAPFMDLAAYIPPDRTAVPLDRYTALPEAVGVETKRGCIMECTYCIYGFLNGKTLRMRPPEQIADEIGELAHRHGITRFTFVDSVFNIPAAHATTVCRELIRRKIPATWSAWFETRGLTRDLVELAREAGCRNVILSPDGFSDETLRRLGKRMTTADLLATHRMLEGIDGVDVGYNFFKNPPGQTLAGALAMLRFCVQAKRALRRRVHFEFNAMRVEPHTGLHEIAIREGAVAPNDPLLYPRYYSQRRTWYVEAFFNLLLRAWGK